MAAEFTNLIAEKAVAASAITKYSDVFSPVSADDFTTPLYRIVYATVQKLYEEKREISFATIFTAIKSEAAPLAMEFMTEFQQAQAEVFPEPMIREVSELGKKRRYAELLRGMYERLRKEPIEEVTSYHDQNVRGLSSVDHTALTYGSDGIGLERFKNQFTPTGLSMIDEIIHGVMPGQLILLAARTAGGKTALGLRIAMNLSLKAPALVFSLEMLASEIELRIICMEAEIDMPSIGRGDLTAEQRERFDRADIECVKKYRNLRIYDQIASIEWIVAMARRNRMKGPLSCIVVDYIQLVKTKKSRERHLEVAEVSRELKQLGKELGCPVIGLAQLNRLADGEEPQLSHLRESGSLEQDANVVIFLYQHEDDKGTDRSTLIVAKNRQGRVGKKNIMFKREHLKFGQFMPYEVVGAYENPKGGRK